MRSDDASLSGTWLLLLASLLALGLLFERTLDYQERLMDARRLAGAVTEPQERSDSSAGWDARFAGADADAGSGEGGEAGDELAGRSVSASAQAEASPASAAVSEPVAVPSSTPAERSAPAAADPDAVTPARQPASSATSDAAPARETTASADLESLRRLLAEAAALDATPEADAVEGREGEDRDGEGRVGGRREVDLATLAALSGAIRFAPDSAVPVGRAGEILDGVTAVLERRPKAPVTVTVLGRERADARRDLVLRRERGRAIIAALVERGLAFSRFSIDVTGGESRSSGAHRIRIVAGETNG